MHSAALFANTVTDNATPSLAPLPLFPLPVCLLPGGFMKLRIFEPRYHRLVAQACKNNQGFVIGMLNQEHQLLPIGVHATIVDFDHLDDGMLGITINAIQRVELQHIHEESDGLQQVQIKRLPNWPQTPVDDGDHLIQATLEQLFTSQQLPPYPSADFEDMSWLCQRWLEILPLPTQDKLLCINPPNHLTALALLRSLLYQHSQ